MAFFTKYRSTYTENAISYQLDLIVDAGSDPGVTSIKVSDVKIRFALANAELLYGSLTYLLSANLFVTEAIAEDIADDLALGPGLLRCRYTRNSVVMFEGYVEPYQILKSVDPAPQYKITISASCFQSRAKRVSVSRLTSGISTVFVWLFETNGGASAGGIFHSWRALAPSVAVPTTLFGTEFNPAIMNDSKAFDLNQRLALLFQFVYGWSTTLGYPVLMHSERFLADGTKIEGSTRTATTLVVQGVVTALASGQGSYANGGFGYFRVLADGVELNTATSDNIIGKEFDVDLNWDLFNLASASVKGLTYRDSPTVLVYNSATYVDPASVATSYDLDEAVKFVVRSTFKNGNKLFYADFANTLIDPVFPFWLILPLSSHLVRARYGELDTYSNKTLGAELVQLSETGTCALTVTVQDPGGAFTDGIFRMTDIETGQLYVYDAFLSKVGPFTFRLPYGTWTLGLYNGPLLQSEPVTLSTPTDTLLFTITV